MVKKKKNCAFFVVLKLVIPSLQHVFNFSVAQPVLGLLTFSLLGLHVHSSLKDTIEKGMVFCPGAPGPLLGVHMPSQDHLSGAAGPCL